jgi:predicted amidophosphoribosyltransferase
LTKVVKVCLECGDKNNSTNSNCSNCGADLKYAQSTQLEEVEIKHISRCPYCGAEIKRDVSNCPSCGEFISKTIKSSNSYSSKYNARSSNTFLFINMLFNTSCWIHFRSYIFNFK